MARQTRSERRARREAQLASRAAHAQARPAAATNGTELDRTQPAQPGRGVPGMRFVGESWGELRKVEWPGQNQVIQGTAVVLIACVIVGFFLYVSDQVFRRLVENVFLGQ